VSNILVHNNWDPLEEIWLGDVWPTHFYDDLEPAIRDAFCQITEWTKEDLNNVQKKLEEFNVVVKRPYVDGDKSLYLDPDNHNKLLKPPITPRDNNAVIGDKLFFSDRGLKHCYEPLLKEYPTEQIIRDIWISGACAVKLGRDIIIDRFIRKVDDIENIYKDFHKQQRVYKPLIDNYRIHYATNGGHVDGCFMPLKPGLLLATNYWTDYEVMFPDWKKITLNSPTYQDYPGWNSDISFRRWMLPNAMNPGVFLYPYFNEYVETYCSEWIGNYKETYFEVNVLVIDEKNILCMGEHPTLFAELEKHGITCHVVPFRTRTFWDGGLHCITLDTRRKAELKDHFPERKEYGIKSALTTYFNNDTNAFLAGYANWKQNKGL